MDHAVAIVEAYLQINGYFTVAEYPVIEAKQGRQFIEATDLDLLAFRFPGAGRLVTGDGDEHTFAPDPELGIDRDHEDMLIAEVKEGRASLNPAVRDPEVLRIALARFGCCESRHAHATATKLIKTGEAMTPAGHRVRMVVFGSNAKGQGSAHYTTISMSHVIRYIESYLDEHWEVLHHAQFKHPALGMMMVRAKALREEPGEP